MKKEIMEEKIVNCSSCKYYSNLGGLLHCKKHGFTSSVTKRLCDDFKR
ncbi:MAG: hypothetical protein NTW30_04550 [Candidatus Aenigmarchaeota archaeon]|nr:hypothetical protein [Candidatus Aenigmarchaeota archaeon]